MNHHSQHRQGSLVPARQDPPQLPQSDLLTAAECAQWLRVDATTIRRWIKFGALEAILLPRKGKRRTYRIPRATIEQILQ